MPNPMLQSLQNQAGIFSPAMQAGLGGSAGPPGLAGLMSSPPIPRPEMPAQPFMTDAQPGSQPTQMYNPQTTYGPLTTPTFQQAMQKGRDMGALLQGYKQKVMDWRENGAGQPGGLARLFNSGGRGDWRRPSPPGTPGGGTGSTPGTGGGGSTPGTGGGTPTTPGQARAVDRRTPAWWQQAQ